MLVSASSPSLRGRSTKVRATPRIRRADFIIDVSDKASMLTRPSHETSSAGLVVELSECLECLRRERTALLA